MAAVQQPLDELAAGSLWRAHKLQSFRDRVRFRAVRLGWRTADDATLQARALGLADDPAVARALEGVAEHTEALEALAARQRDGTQARPWWADGEYDDTRADAANDAGARPRSARASCGAYRRRLASARHAGMACLQRKELLPAYDAFTEAIRLSPSKARARCGPRCVAARAAEARAACTRACRRHTTPTAPPWRCS